MLSVPSVVKWLSSRDQAEFARQGEVDVFLADGAAFHFGIVAQFHGSKVIRVNGNDNDFIGVFDEHGARGILHGAAEP